jgi:hypothetical protein
MSSSYKGYLTKASVGSPNISGAQIRRLKYAFLMMIRVTGTGEMGRRAIANKQRRAELGKWVLLALLGLAGSAAAQTSNAQGPNPHAVAAIDGGIGSCSVVFTVTNGKGMPVYNAKVKVHISYGFLGAHKLDLEVGTNVDGKARFTGLPNKVKQALHFLGSKGDLEGGAFYDPNHNCNAKHDIVLLTPQASGYSQP